MFSFLPKDAMHGCALPVCEYKNTDENLHVAIVERLYTPQAFMERYLHSYQYPEYHKRRAEMCDKAKEGAFIPTLGYGLILLWNLFWTLLKDGSFSKLAPTYLRYYRKARKFRSDTIGFAQYLNRCVTHFHFYRFTREAREGKLRTYNSG